jgi:quinol-cytochrome oxidoreductase complex cytochrome b subunit
MVLPLALVMLVGIHFWRIRKDGGLSRPEELDEKDSVEGRKPVFERTPSKTYGLMCLVKGTSPVVNKGPENTVISYPNLLIAELAGFMITIAISLILAFYLDAPLKEIANPSIPENPAKAPWYFLGLQELVSYSAFMGGIGIPSIIIIGLGLIPYLDREKKYVGIWFSNPEGRKIAWHSLIYSALVVIGIFAFTVIFGWLRTWFPNIPQIIITIVNPGTLIVLLFAGWSIYILKKTNSTRMAAIALFTCFLVGFTILTYIGTFLRGPNWGFYWSKSQWPVL